MQEQTVGVYVHVPFCQRVCPYCDFAVVARRALSPEEEERYVAALLTELEARRHAFAGLGLESLYMGGGTPSLLRPESVARLVDAVGAAFAAGATPAEPLTSAGVEITLEVNPSTLERQRLPDFRQAGVNRLSLGIQSFDDALLRRLGRAHKAAEARATLAALRPAGFAEISLDLVWGIPGQDLDGLRRDLAELVAFAPDHVSAYELTVEKGTPYALAVLRGQFVPPAEDLAVAMFAEVRSQLEAAGLEAYEISSYGRPGHRSRHNRRYWARRPVLGLGVGAWSSEPRTPERPHGARLSNERELDAWLGRVEGGGGHRPGALELLDARTARGEAMFLALRTREGLSASCFRAEFGGAPRDFFGTTIEELVGAGLLVEGPEGDLQLSREGWPLADGVAQRFV